MKNNSNTVIYVMIGVGVVGVLVYGWYKKNVQENKAISFIQWVNSKL